MHGHFGVRLQYQDQDETISKMKEFCKTTIHWVLMSRKVQTELAQT